MKTLKKFEFKSATDRNEHDWNKLLDGGIYQLTEGDDYKCKTGTMVMMTRSRAADRGQTVAVNQVEGGVVLQATSEPDEAKAAARKEHIQGLIAARKAKKAEAVSETPE